MNNKIIQWDGLNRKEVAEFVGIKNCVYTSKEDMSKFTIITNKGDFRIADLDDFIIEGVDNDFYPIKENVLRLFVGFTKQHKIMH